MGYRRLFIMRKDLRMSPGKLAAQVGHCAEAYWTNMLRSAVLERSSGLIDESTSDVLTYLLIDKEIFKQYVMGSFVKTICQARNKNDLLKVVKKAEELGLEKYSDFGFIYDNCLTELEAEENDGTVLTGVWFKPLPDEISHKLSKNYQLYTG